MITAEPFVYGRTRTVDYRWLQKPALPLRVGFFADALERCSPNLRKGHRAYFVALDDGGCVLAVMLSLKEAEDQRGRTISFVLGYTVDTKAARDFAYHLPALLESCDRTVSRYLDSVIQCVESDGQVSIAPFDLMSSGLYGTDKFSRPYEGADRFSERDLGGAELGTMSKPTGDRVQPIINTQDGVGQILDGWLSRTAASIRSSVNTPRVVSNFDIGNLGGVFDRFEETSNLFDTGTIPYGQSSHPSPEARTTREDSAPLEQMRRFVGKSDGAAPNSTGQYAAKAFGDGSSDEFSLHGSKNIPKTQPPAPVRHGLLDLLFGKSDRSRGSTEK